MVLIHCIKLYPTVLDRTNIKEKLQYTHGFDIWEEDMCSLEDIILRDEDGMDGEVTDVGSDEEEKGEDDEIEILSASSRRPRLQEI